MKPLRTAFVAVLVCCALLHGVAGVAAMSPPAGEEGEEDVAAAAAAGLSPYWHSRVRQWESLIVLEAERRNLDPDFVASLVWMESRGNSQAIGPVGAVGLTQVMPSEAGFTWRPARAQLLDPGTNLFWGTRTLATVVGQGQGDIFNALAAYNGGWEQIQYRGPRIFATTILRDYAQAVAVREGLRGQPWRAIFAVTSPDIGGPIYVADSARDDVYLFGNDNWVPEGYPLIPAAAAPTAIVAHGQTEEGATFDVAVWFFLTRQESWYSF
ncbi:MAG: transglycosylase SLT domain-containing protein [Anaerolineae bacterium]|nr:transglycosylase SLT domain-containing protein [Anaerolineae bacterium]